MSPRYFRTFTIHDQVVYEKRGNYRTRHTSVIDKYSSIQEIKHMNM